LAVNQAIIGTRISRATQQLQGTADMGARAEALVITSNEPAVREVYVAEKQVVASGRHPQENVIAGRFSDAMKPCRSK